ncbi:MAG: ribonuclease P protein component [Pirellulales bacterium]|nr:ribonuclease P protein component [Pirellulales bacterium]
MPKHHVRSGLDFRRAYARGCKASDHRIIVVGCENGLEYCRLGLSVSRRVGKAIVRNRWKRLIRETFRLIQRRLPQGIDLIVIPRLGVEPDLVGLIESLPRLAGRVREKLGKRGIGD